MGIISYAQNQEDVLLNRVFAGQNYGFYVDIGAYHPAEDSVTKAFYDRGWSGLNIEPGEIFPVLAQARPRDINLQMAVFDRQGEVDFVQHPGWYAGLSHIGQPSAQDSPDVSRPEVSHRKVACDTLEALLDRHAPRRPIAFLKIDAEGAEGAIVRSTDWRRIRPTVLLLEATLPLSNLLDNADWEPLLLQQGYLRAWFDGVNCWYVPEERRDLLAHFVLPVNSLDGFHRHDPRLAECERELAESRARLNAAAEDQARYAALAELAASLQEALAILRARAEQREVEKDELTLQVEAIAGRQSLLVAEAGKLHRLVRTLNWPDGPAALRAVLPAARLLRRLSGRRAPAQLPQEIAIAAMATGPAPLPATYAPIAPPRSLKRRIALAAWAPLRPVLRPMAWRGRGFLTAELHQRMARLESRLDMLAGHAAIDDPAEQVNLRVELRQLGRMMEDTLLTLALEGPPLREPELSVGAGPVRQPAGEIAPPWQDERGGAGP